MSLFEKKPLDKIIAESEAGECHLRSTLGPINLIALGIAAIIGAGLFSLTGMAAADHAGPAVVLSFVVAQGGFVPISNLSHFTSIGTLLAFLIVCIGIVVMRRTNPEALRPYRTPLVPLVPILEVLVCLGMMAFLDVMTWIRLAGWLLIGLVIFFGYSRNHSHLRHAGRGR